MPISDVLYLRLADALSQPSRAYRAAKAGLEIPEKALEGYREGGKIGDELRQRKLAKSSLSEALGGRVPPGLEGFGDTSVEAAGELAKPIIAISDLQKALREGQPKPGENYNAEQTEAVASGDPAKLAKAFGGVVPRTAVAANTTARGVTGKNEYFGTRGGQIDLSQLPSELGPNTAAGAAFGVKVAARQGKSIVAKPGSAQRISLASGDIARAVLRAAPQLDTIRGADFSSNLATRISSIGQKITANPKGPDVPMLRKEMYDILDDLDKSATPFIANHLANYEATLKPLSPEMKKRELGENLPDIPFDAGGSQIPFPANAPSFKTEQEAVASGYKGPAIVAGKKAVLH